MLLVDVFMECCEYVVCRWVVEGGCVEILGIDGGVDGDVEGILGFF